MGGRCEYGEQECCGETSPDMICQCTHNGIVQCIVVDTPCMMGKPCKTKTGRPTSGTYLSATPKPTKSTYLQPPKTPKPSGTYIQKTPKPSTTYIQKTPKPTN